jgi:hypothetical protein
MEREPLEGIRAADAHLGRRVPLPTAPLPLTSWSEVFSCGAGAVEIAWNLDATRARTPGRLALYVGRRPAPERGLPEAAPLGRYARRSAPLSEAEPELRPVEELSWEHDGLHLRLTGQGPWKIAELVGLADSTR